MFYCEACRIKNGWPDSLSQSSGKCECCDTRANCWDRPSSSLPLPTTEPAPVPEGAVEIDPKDLRIETYRRNTGGFGNAPDNCCRLTHVPTGITITVEDSDERSIYKAKAKAMELLGHKLVRIAKYGHEDRWSELEKKAKAADQGEGQHIYSHPRDSNNYLANEAWVRAAGPALFLELIAIARRAGVTEPVLQSVRDTCR